MRYHCALVLTATSMLAASANATVTVVAGNFDQVAAINQIGGTVNQVGGGSPGAALFTGAGFVGAAGTGTGVAVTLPSFLQTVASTSAFTDVGGSEPGNIPSLLIGVPTDITYTTPGAGGPDGTIGDGSIHFTKGDSVTVCFAPLITVIPGTPADMIVFTDTAGGGRADFVFTLNGMAVAGITNVTVPGGAVDSGMGGLALNLPDGLVFDCITITGRHGEVEIDAIAVLIPTPGAAALLGLAGLAASRRRRA